MTTVREPPFGSPARRPRRRGLRFTVFVLGAAAVFALGVAVGDALDDNPEPGGTLTYVRTLQPVPLEPAPRERTSPAP